MDGRSGWYATGNAAEPMTTGKHGFLGAFSIFVALAGCQGEGGEPSDDAAFRGGTGWGCRTCGYSNSPYMGVHPLEDFQLGGDAVDGFRLLAIVDDNDTQYAPALDGDAIVATKSGVSFSGTDLVGWRLVFQDSFGAPFEVEIVNYQTHPDWVEGRPVDTYSLAYDDGGELTNVCPGYDLDETSVVVLAGETYDLSGNTVQPSQKNRATLACRGHALMKMKMFGYDPTDTYGSTAAQRQATIRMVTADYCGDGVSWTDLGTHYQPADARGSQPLQPGVLEAKFDADGAVCLDTPRVALRSDVEAHCGKIPTCAGNTQHGAATWVVTF